MLLRTEERLTKTEDRLTRTEKAKDKSEWKVCKLLNEKTALVKDHQEVVEELGKDHERVVGGYEKEVSGLKEVIDLKNDVIAENNEALEKKNQVVEKLEEDLVDQVLKFRRLQPNHYEVLGNENNLEIINGNLEMMLEIEKEHSRKLEHKIKELEGDLDSANKLVETKDVRMDSLVLQVRDLRDEFDELEVTLEKIVEEDQECGAKLDEKIKSLEGDLDSQAAKRISSTGNDAVDSLIMHVRDLRDKIDVLEANTEGQQSVESTLKDMRMENGQKDQEKLRGFWRRSKIGEVGC